MRRSLFLIPALIASLTQMGGQHYKNAKDALAEGIRLYNENKFQESLQALDAAAGLSRKPEPDVYNYRCMDNFLLQRYEPALADCRQLTILQPASESAWHNYGLVCQAVGQHDRAIESFSQAILLNPKDFKPLRNRASSYERLDRFQEALADYGRALELEPDDADTLVRRAHIYNIRGDYRHAEDDAEAAVARNSKSAEALQERGEARLHQERYEASIADFTEAIRLNPAWTWPLVKRCESYLARNEPAKALEDCNEAVKRAPDVSDLLADRAEVYLALQRYPEALEDAQKAILLGQKDARLYDIQGRANEGLGNWERAIRAYDEAIGLEPNRWQFAVRDYDEALGLDPSRTLAYLHRAHARRLSGDPEGSRRELAYVHRLVHSDPKLSASLKRELASELSASGDLDSALSLLEELRAGDQKDTQTLIQLAAIHRERKNYPEARRAIDAILARTPDSRDALREQALLLTAEGRFADAVPILRRVLDLTAKSSYTAGEADRRSNLLIALGSVYNALGEHGRAVETWRQLGLFSPHLGAWAEQQVVLSWQAAGQTAKALAASEAALKQYPDSPGLLLVRADLLAKSGKLEQAVADVRALLARKSDFETWLELAVLLEQQRNYKEASDAFEAAAILAHSLEQLRTLNLRRAAFYDRTGQFEAAETEYRQLIDREPGNAAAMNALASFYSTRRIKTDQAERLVKRVLELDPDNGTYQDSLGWLYFGKGELVDAERYLRMASEHRPHDPTILDHLAQLYAKEEKWKEAATSWGAALKENETASVNALGPTEVTRIRAQLENARMRAAKASARALIEKR